MAIRLGDGLEDAMGVDRLALSSGPLPLHPRRPQVEILGEVGVDHTGSGEMSSDPGPELSIQVLGAFRVRHLGRAVEPKAWERDTARQVVKLLAVRPGHQMHRDEIIEALWPGSTPRSNLNNFAKALHAARRALEPDLQSHAPSAYLHFQRDIVSFAPAVWVDLDQFEDAARRALASRRLEGLLAALDVYGGPLLPEDRYEEWALRRREEVGLLYLRVLEMAAVTLEERGLDQRAVEMWERVLREEPAREDVHRRVMRLYALQGRTADAVRQYHQARAALRHEVGVGLDPDTESLYERIVRGDVGYSGTNAAGVRPALPPILRRPPETPLVGRDTALGMAESTLRSARLGAGSVLILEGEPGIGKTRLMTEIALRAYDGENVVLWGAGYAQSQVAPYGPFLDALEGYLAAAGPAERETLAHRYPLLARLLPSLAGFDLPDEPVPPDVLHARLVATFCALLAHLGEREPVVLALDNLDLADTQTVHLVQRLGRLAPQHGWVILASYRSATRARSAELEAALAALLSEGRAQRLAVDRLSRDDTALVVRSIAGDDQVDAALADRVYGLSLGNPLFAEELARAVQRGETLEEPPDRLRAHPAVPTRVGEIVTGRLAHVPPDVLRVLELISVKDGEWSWPMLEGAYARTHPDVSVEHLSQAVDIALDASILVSAEHSYAFRHPLVRLAVLGRTPLHRRARFHAAVAETIEADDPEALDILAYHYSHAGREDKALHYIDRAAERARELRAYSEAHEYYREAARLYDRHRDPAKAALVRLRDALALLQLGRYAEASDSAHLALPTFAERGDVRRMAGATSILANSSFHLGRTREGLATVDGFRAAWAGQIAEAELAPLLVSRASLLWAEGRYEEGMADVTAALSLLSSSKEGAWARATGQLWRGILLVALDRVDEGIEVLEEVVPDLEAAGSLMGVSQAWNTIAAAHQERGDVRGEEPYLTRAIEAAERTANPTRLAFLYFRKAWHHLILGEWQEARVYVDRATVLDTMVMSAARPYIRYIHAWLAAAGDNWDLAEEHIAAGIAAANDAQNARALWAFETLCAEHEMDAGEPEKALTRLKGLQGSRGVSGADIAYFKTLMAEALIALGRIDDAAPLVAEATSTARDLRSKPALMDALRVAGKLATAQGQDPEPIFAEALTLARDMENPYAEGLLLYARAASLIYAGNVRGADVDLDTGRRLFVTLGAIKDQRLVQEARTRLREYPSDVLEAARLLPRGIGRASQ